MKLDILMWLCYNVILLVMISMGPWKTTPPRPAQKVARWPRLVQRDWFETKETYEHGTVRTFKKILRPVISDYGIFCSIYIISCKKMSIYQALASISFCVRYIRKSHVPHNFSRNNYSDLILKLFPNEPTTVAQNANSHYTNFVTV